MYMLTMLYRACLIRAHRIRFRFQFFATHVLLFLISSICIACTIGHNKPAAAFCAVCSSCDTHTLYVTILQGRQYRT